MELHAYYTRKKEPKSEITKEFEYQVYHRLGLNLKCSINIDDTDDLDRMFNKLVLYILLLRQLMKPNQNIYSYDW
jgi:hypothetical protein